MSKLDAYTYEFDPEAENNTAAAIYRYARAGGPRVLDLGSGPGIVAAHLVHVDAREVVCLDNDQSLLAAAKSRGVQRVVEADLEDESWANNFSGESFDVIVLADVLEHLVDPGRVLDTIRKRDLLAENGVLVVSVPNASHESLLLSLLAGRFTYTDSGLLDRTHVRWFTRDSFKLLCEEHGYVVTATARTLRTLPQTMQRGLMPDFSSVLREELARYSDLDSRTYQYVFRVERMEAATEVRELRAQLDVERDERVTVGERLNSEIRDAAAALEDERARSTEELGRRDELIRKLGRDLTELRAQKARELSERDERIAQMSEELDAAQAEADELRAADRLARRTGTDPDATLDRVQAQLRAERKERERLERKVEMVYESETWKLGNALLWLPKKLTRRGRSD